MENTQSDAKTVAEKFQEQIRASLVNKLQVMADKKAKGEAITYADKVKVAVLADSPTVVTGFGKVCKEILTMLYETGFYEFEIVGINYDGSPHGLPFKIHPAINGLIGDPLYREPYGRQKFLDVVGTGDFDIVWVLQDSFIVCEELCQRIKETNDALPVGNQFAFVYYFPIDATPKKRWIDQSALIADLPVVYTEYGYQEVMKLYAVDENSKLTEEEKAKNSKDFEAMKAKISVVYHGTNTEDFHPLPDEDVKTLRAKLWQEHQDKFVFINVNRNQPRKDMFRTLQAFKILLDSRRAKGKDDVYLYLHCNVFDNNMNLIDMAKQIGLVEGDEFSFPDPKRFGPSTGFPISMVNEIYAASDAVVTTTLGEGWGLSITEAMATGKPILAPDHTSIPEILGKTDKGNAERGFIIKTKGDFVQPNDNARVRPITDPQDLAETMEFVVENRQHLKPMTDGAMQWAKKLDWRGEEVGGKWIQIFEMAVKVAIAKRAAEVDKELVRKLGIDQLGRNDECPLCKDKYKNCRHFPK